MLYHTCMQGKAELLAFFTLLFYYYYSISFYYTMQNGTKTLCSANMNTRKRANTFLLMSFE